MSGILLLFRVFLFSVFIGCYSACASNSESPDGRDIHLYALSPHQTRFAVKEASKAYVAELAEPMMAIILEPDQPEPSLDDNIDQQEESDSISETSDYPYHDIATGCAIHDKPESDETMSVKKLPGVRKKSASRYKAPAKKAKKSRPSKPQYQVKSGKGSKVKKTTKTSKKRTYICLTCKSHFTHSSNLVRHRREQHSSFGFTCRYCHKEFKRKESYDGHLNTHSENVDRKLYECSSCEKKFFGQRQLRAHKARAH